MKKAKDFAQQTAGETFELDKAAKKEGGPADEGKIVLNIGRSNKKIALKKKLGIEQTGNFFLDIYKKFNDKLIQMGKVKLQEKAVFFRLLAVMVDAGIPIIRALETLAEQNEKNKKFQRAISDMAVKIEEGESLSGAMEKHTDIFNDSQVGMIRSGEVSGHLNDILRDMAKESEKNARTISKVKGALTYPIVVLTILFIVLFLMMVFVVPNIVQLFLETGTELPTITKIVIGMSDFMRNNALIIIGVILIVVISIVALKKTKEGKYYWDVFMLKIPIIGDLLKKSTLAQFARSLGNLLGAGVSITQSLHIIGNAMKNDVYKKKLKHAGDDIKGGIPLAETLRNSDEFPNMLVNMIEVGEQTAQLENVSKKVAIFYDEQVDTAVKSLTKVMEPIIIVFVGIAVGGLVAAIMLPILNMSSVIGAA
jgi:type IV pilus assembly protein PilC